MTNSFVLTPTKLVSVEPDGANVKGIVAFRDYKGDIHQLDFVAYGETAKKLQGTKTGSKFECDGSLDIFKERDYLTVFSISSISAIKPPDEGEPVAESEPVEQPIAITPVKVIAPKAPVEAPSQDEEDLDSVPF